MSEPTNEQKARECVFSRDRVYRYTLWREWPEPELGLCSLVATGRVKSGSYVQFIGLNPSTADEKLDDPTIRRCIAYAKAWGYGAMCMTNLFAFRATDPRHMMCHPEPIGPENDAWLRRTACFASLIVCAWGTKGEHLNRGQHVRDLFPRAMHCLRLTKEGHPEHPLYLPKTLTPIPL